MVQGVDEGILVRMGGKKMRWVLTVGILLGSAGWTYGCPLNVVARKAPDRLSSGEISKGADVRESPSDRKDKRAEGTPVASSTSGVSYADSKDFAEKVLHAQGPVLVDFYADGCPPCRLVAAVLQELAREMPHVQIVKVNIESNPDLASQYRVQAIPSLKVFRGGRIAAEHVGLANKQQLQALLREAVPQ